MLTVTQKLVQGREGAMRNRGGLLTLVVCLGFAAASTAVSATTSTWMGTKKTAEAEARLMKAPLPSSSGSASKSHLFPINDEKGLLLTCSAPDIDINANTDLFEDCTLAPGRTLNDVVHSFVGAMHAEEKQRTQERTEWLKDFEEKSSQTAGKK
jgi:hypothetical protein